jgi:hypothetical protein
MEQLDVSFTPANGEPPRTITIRIGTPVRGERSWTARVEVLAGDDTHAWTVQGTDWVQVLELSTWSIPTYLHGIVNRAGGGTLDPYFYERDPRPPTELPPEVAAVLGRPAGGAQDH